MQLSNESDSQRLAVYKHTKLSFSITAYASQ